MTPPAAWAESYLNIPYTPHGRDRAGVDCYGLVCVVYREQLGVELPSYVEGYATENDREEILRLIQGAVGSSWQDVPVAEAKPYDGVLIRISGQATHCGVVVSPPWFLHAIKRTNGAPGRTWLERWDSLLWRTRLLGIVRWQEQSCGR